MAACVAGCPLHALVRLRRFLLSPGTLPAAKIDGSIVEPGWVALEWISLEASPSIPLSFCYPFLVFLGDDFGYPIFPVIQSTPASSKLLT